MENVAGKLHIYHLSAYMYNIPVNTPMIVTCDDFGIFYDQVTNHFFILIHQDTPVYSMTTQVLHENYIVVTRINDQENALSSYDFLIDISNLKINEAYITEDIKKTEDYDDYFEFLIPDESIVSHGRQENKKTTDTKEVELVFLQTMLKKALAEERYKLADEIKKTLGD